MEELPYLITNLHSRLQPSSLLGAGTSDLSINISITQMIPSKNHQDLVSQTPEMTHNLQIIPQCALL